MKKGAFRWENRFEALEAVGLPSSTDLSRTHYTGTIKKPRDQKGSVIVHPDGNITIGNFREHCQALILSPTVALKNTWKNSQKSKMKFGIAGKKPSPEERYRIVAKGAYDFWKRCRYPDKENLHPYYRRKDFEPTETQRETDRVSLRRFFGYTPKMDGNRFIVNIMSDGFMFTGFQLINENGTKRFYPAGLKVSGAFWQVENYRGRRPGVIAIAEGVATVSSFIQNNQNQGIMGVAAMSAGNLVSVAKFMRSKYVMAPILILADIDSNECGQDSAYLACQAAKPHAEVLSPSFSEEDIKLFTKLKGEAPTDWNDFYWLKKNS